MLMLDATISGTSEMCAVKDTIFMVGGKQEIYTQCEPLFAAMGRESVYMGKSGTGASIKIVVNLVLSLNRMALAEGLALALSARLDCPLPLISLNAQALASEMCKGRGDWDSSAIIKFYEALANH